LIQNSLKNQLLQKPITLVDVGFKGGVQEKWLPLKKNLNVIGFEPNKEEYDRLKKDDSHEIIFNTALWNEKRSIDFYVTRAERLCSCLEPNRKVLDEFPESERFDVLKKKVLPADIFDNVLKKSTLEGEMINPDFVKLDTQGTELFILQGMQQTLTRAIFGVEVEVEFIEMYRDQPLFHEVDDFMRKRGFHLFDLKKFYWRRKCGMGFDGNKRGQVVHGDALYFRKADVYLGVLENSGINIKARLLKSVAIVLFFGYSDYAIKILDKAMKKKVISVNEYSLISKTIRKTSRINISLPNFKGKRLLRNIFLKLFDSSYNGWAMTDKPDLGN